MYNISVNAMNCSSSDFLKISPILGLCLRYLTTCLIALRLEKVGIASLYYKRIIANLISGLILIVS